MYVCVCVCMYVYMYVYMYVCMYVCMYVYMYIYICMYVSPEDRFGRSVKQCVATASSPGANKKISC